MRNQHANHPRANSCDLLCKTIHENFTATVAGTVEAFDQAAYITQLAITLGIDASLIALNVQAASVSVTAIITTTSASIATTSVSTLSSMTPSDLTTALGSSSRQLSHQQVPRSWLKGRLHHHPHRRPRSRLPPGDASPHASPHCSIRRG